jgi:hypothetical protein
MYFEGKVTKFPALRIDEAKIIINIIFEFLWEDFSQHSIIKFRKTTICDKQSLLLREYQVISAVFYDYQLISNA